MPQSLILPSEKAESDAVFSALYTQLHQIYKYTDLRTNVFQNFREFGNILICCLQLEKNLVSFFQIISVNFQRNENKLHFYEVLRTH